MTNPLSLAIASLVLICGAGAISAGPALADAPAADGSTRVAQWKDDKKAAFALMFDDSCVSQVKNAIPELKKRHLIGTFYVNPGSGQWKAMKDAWEKEIPAMGMEYGNHTMTHKGILGVTDGEQEVGLCNQVIMHLCPGSEPRLISFARPGVKNEQWTITEKDLGRALAAHHLIERPPFAGHGAMIHQKTAQGMMRLVDRAVSKGGMEYIVFHGVGGDWLATPMPVFTSFLDQLAKSDDVWVTGYISAYRYEMERKAAKVEVQSVSTQQIDLKLTCSADPALYDQPLTLVTHVPSHWASCQATQGARTITAAARAGLLQYDAIPNGQAITIRPVAN